jgi:hypothetical protein
MSTQSSSVLVGRHAGSILEAKGPVAAAGRAAKKTARAGATSDGVAKMPSAGKGKSRAVKAGGGRAALTARTADKYALYQASVQEPDADLDFVDREYRRAFGRLPARLREDFCGTALTASRFVQRRGGNTALGVDLDPACLAWGERNIVAGLTPDQRSRLKVMRANVLSDEALRAGPFDAILAFNFSYWILQERAALVEYFRRCRGALAREGMLVLDFMAGSDVLTESTERSRKRGFTYVWEQRRYDPIGGEMTCHIGFEFPDGTSMPRAFTYTWRLWTMPEVRDVLREAGFASVETFIEGEDAKGKGTGVYVKRARGPADRCLLAYIIARVR